MRRAIEDLFNGRIIPYDQKHVQSEKYLAAIKRMAELEEQLLVTLDDSGKGIFEAYQDAHADVIVEKDMANFIYGFRLCARLIYESLDDGNVTTGHQ